MRVCPQCGRKYSEGEAFCPFDGARLRSEQSLKPVDADPFAGRVLDGRYRLEKVLGRGGMGTVYAAKQVALAKPCAIKLLRPVLDDDGQAMGRFEREARAASKLGNRHIVDVFDFGKTRDGLAFLVMELLDGKDLGDVLGVDRRLSIDRAVPIIMQCCEALGAAHAAGIVHRDLKPENVFLVSRPGIPEFVKIVDFGLAKFSDTEQEGDPTRKLTKTGMIFGTPQYMSPEQCMGKPTDHRSDVYSLGLIFYELLVGRVPFDADTFMGVINQHLVDPPPPMRTLNPDIKVPVALEAVIYRCLDKKAGNRPQSMPEMAEEIISALREGGLHGLAARFAPVADIAEPVSAMRLTKKKPSRRPPASLSPSASPLPKPAPVPSMGFAETAPAHQSVDVEAVAASLPPSQRPPPADLSPSQRPPAPLPAAPLPPTRDPRAPRPTPTARSRAPRLDLETDPTMIAPPTSKGVMWWVAFALGLLVLGGALGYALVLLG